MRLIFGKLALPCADGELNGCWWRKHHLVMLDGSTLALQDTASNESHFVCSNNQPMFRFIPRTRRKRGHVNKGQKV